MKSVLHFHARSVYSLPDSGARSSGGTLTWRHEGKLFFASPRMMLCRLSRGRVVERVEKFISGEWSLLVGIKPSAGEDDNNPMTLNAVWSLVQMRIFRREAGIGGCCCCIWDSTNVGHVARHVAAILWGVGVMTRWDRCFLGYVDGQVTSAQQEQPPTSQGGHWLRVHSRTLPTSRLVRFDPQNRVLLLRRLRLPIFQHQRHANVVFSMACVRCFGCVEGRCCWSPLPPGCVVRLAPRTFS